MTHGRGGVPTQDRYRGPQPQKREVDKEHAKVSSEHKGAGGAVDGKVRRRASSGQGSLATPFVVGGRPHQGMNPTPAVK